MPRLRRLVRAWMAPERSPLLISPWLMTAWLVSPEKAALTGAGASGIRGKAESAVDDYNRV